VAVVNDGKIAMGIFLREAIFRVSLFGDLRNSFAFTGVSR
jgi:hypothetical protein